MTSNREAKQRQRDLDRLERKQWYVYNHALGYAEHRWFIQVRFSHKQRLAEHLRRKDRRILHKDKKYNPNGIRLNTNLLPWQ